MDKKVAIVTGAASGIGQASALKFVKAGYIVAIIDISPALEKTEEMITGMGGVFLSCVGDVQNEAAMENFINTVIQTYGRIDVLNNNAGIVVVKPLEDTKFEEFERVAKVNIGGTFILTKLVLPVMKQQKEGAIVNLGSVSGHVGQTEHAIYGATKGAVIAFTRAVAWEVADYGIRVNSVSPGSVDTPMLRSDIQLEATRTGMAFDEVKRLREEEQAFKRWADPSEIAEAIYFLAGDGASFITGSDLLVDCGWTAK
ncbi:MAG: SDR family NAD(P)-dependent oxidoreductase [Lachnospiraceae bacterium]